MDPKATYKYKLVIKQTSDFSTEVLHGEITKKLWTCKGEKETNFINFRSSRVITNITRQMNTF